MNKGYVICLILTHTSLFEVCSKFTFITINFKLLQIFLFLAEISFSYELRKMLLAPLSVLTKQSSCK